MGDDYVLRPGDKALLIDSVVLQESIWLVIDPLFKFDPEGLACFYLSEIPKLRNKTEAQLIDIHKTRLAFPHSRVTR